MNKSNKSVSSLSKKISKPSTYYVLLLFILCVGFFIGYLVSKKQYQKKIVEERIIFFQKQSVKAQRKAVFKDTTSLQLINPLSFTLAYRYMQFKELKPFKDKIEKYIEGAIDQHSLTRISVYFRDMTNGRNFGINQTEKYVHASLNKVAVLITALKKSEIDIHFLSKKLVYNGSMEQTALYHDPMSGISPTILKSGNEYTIEELLKIMIKESDNEATRMLVDELTTSAINKTK